MNDGGYLDISIKADDGKPRLVYPIEMHKGETIELLVDEVVDGYNDLKENKKKEEYKDIEAIMLIIFKGGM